MTAPYTITLIDGWWLLTIANTSLRIKCGSEEQAQRLAARCTNTVSPWRAGFMRGGKR